MSIEYDTSEIRRVAARIGAAAHDLNGAVGQYLRPIANDLPDELAGETADALLEVVGELTEDIKAIGRQLESVRTAMERFARKLDETDAAMNDFIKNA